MGDSLIVTRVGGVDEQPHYQSIPLRRSEGYDGPLCRMSDEEYAALTAECLAALDETPPPPCGLPGSSLGYNDAAFRLLCEGREYLQAWAEQSPRKMVNICKSLGDLAVREYWRGHADAMEQCRETFTEKAIAHGRELTKREAEQREAEFVYFVESASGGIKIGKAADPDKRIRSLQTAHPVKLTTLATCLGGERREREYHAQFAVHRLHGEWFAPHPDILAEIERLNLDAPLPLSTRGEAR